jgi:hypothetical protein
MGWSLCVATERDFDKVTWLGRHFSYALLRDDGCLREFITEQEADFLGPDPLDEPEVWEERDAGAISKILQRVREMLREANDRLPVLHFLWLVDEAGGRWNGWPQITIPFGGIDLVYPHEPIVKLDAAHGDVNHCRELKRYRVRIDQVKLEQHDIDDRRRVAELGLAGDVCLSR